jgi:4-hydroxy-3-methylbut-2-enyl diphosphate reductase
MEVVKITPRGYCHGVVKAINIAREQGRSADGLIYALGQLVHNRHVLDDLSSHGVDLVDGQNRLEILEKIEQGTVIFSAHGVAPQVRERATAKGLRWIDATCPDVIRSHDLARDLAAQGYYIIYIGKHGHPEPEGVIGEVPPGRIALVETADEVDALDVQADKIAVLTQTTISVWDTEALVERIRARYPRVEVHNEICRATQDRQEAAVAAARDCDAVIVVGDRRSSNSRRLVEVVRERAGRPAYLVDNVADIDPAWLRGIRRLGVTSGASTPSEVTRAVIQHLEALPDQGA